MQVSKKKKRENIVKTKIGWGKKEEKGIFFFRSSMQGGDAYTNIRTICMYVKRCGIRSLNCFS